jgi:hypothetical protein
MSEAERLSLAAAGEIHAKAVELAQRTPCLSYGEAVRRVMAADELLQAGYAGDTGRVVLARGQGPRTELRQRGNVIQLAQRRIRDLSELEPGETGLIKLAPPSAGGGLFADRI